MNVQLINTYSTRNLGDAAIYAALADRLQARGAQTRLTPDRAARPESADAFISVGGDIFNNAREWLVTRNFVANLHQIARLPPARTMLFGQSIPRSCRGPAFHALAFALRRLAAVSVRDELSHRRLREAGVDARLGLDTAFMLAPGDDWPQIGRALLEHHGLDPARCALMSLRSFGPMYRHDTDAFLTRLARLCELLRRRGHQPAILVQSDVDGADNDRHPAAWLQQQLPGLAIVDPFRAAGVTPWIAAAAAAGAARTVLAVRYHTAIFRMMQGRMPFTLYYSNKGRDLVARLGQPGCALDAFDPESIVAALEDSADLSVDARRLRDIARSDFAACLDAATAGSARAAHTVKEAPNVI